MANPKRMSSITDVVQPWQATAAMQYPARLANAITPGESFQTASGAVYKVMAKQADAQGVRLRIAHQGKQHTIGLSQLAALHPISPAVLKFAHRVLKLAIDQNLDAYVNSAIEMAGYPLDPAMQWAKWLTKVYAPTLRSLTKDDDLIDDAIHEVVVNKLYEKRILQTRFDENNASLNGKPIEKKVSAFLVMVFKRSVPDAVEYVKRALGVGAQGELGLVPTESMTPRVEADDEGGNPTAENRLDLSVDTEDEDLSKAEVRQFLDSFNRWLKQNERPTTYAALAFITKGIVDEDSRSEIRDKLIEQVRGRDGKFNPESFKKLIAKWVQKLTAFTQSSANPHQNTAIGKIILNHLRTAEPGRRSAGLHLALEDTGTLAQQPYSQTTNQPVVVEPAPPQNPNVIQQQEAAGKANNPNQMQQGEQDFQQPGTRVTIPPEIPGVNHA